MFMSAAAKGETLQNKDVDTDNFIGLENFITETSHIEVQAHRYATIRAILTEQQRQNEAGICDPDALAAVSIEESDWARDRAHFFGTLHAPER